MKKLTILLVLSSLFAAESFAMTDAVRMTLLMRLMENNKRRAELEVQEEVRRKSKEKKEIEGTVVYAKADESGQSVAIFETKECGKLGYVPSDYKLAKDLEEKKNVSLSVKDCEITEVKTKSN